MIVIDCKTLLETYPYMEHTIMHIPLKMKDIEKRMEIVNNMFVATRKTIQTRKNPHCHKPLCRVVVPNICTNTHVTNFVTWALLFLVKETLRNSSIFVIQTPSSPKTKIGDIHEFYKLSIMVGGKIAKILHNAFLNLLELMNHLSSGCSHLWTLKACNSFDMSHVVWWAFRWQ